MQCCCPCAVLCVGIHTEFDEVHRKIAVAILYGDVKWKVAIAGVDRVLAAWILRYKGSYLLSRLGPPAHRVEFLLDGFGDGGRVGIFGGHRVCGNVGSNSRWPSGASGGGAEKAEQKLKRRRGGTRC